MLYVLINRYSLINFFALHMNRCIVYVIHFTHFILHFLHFEFKISYEIYEHDIVF